MVLSTDIIHGTLGDLLNAEVTGFWLSYMRSGKVLAILGGPPCESWSTARSRSICTPHGANTTGPRPLRSKQQPWGINGLSPAERQQVNAANGLLRTMVQMMYLACSEGISAVMEHPATPWWNPSAASSWLLPELVRLRAHHSVQMLYVDQCCFGQVFKKPTHFMCINVPELEQLLHFAAEGGDAPTQADTLVRLAATHPAPSRRLR